MNGDSQSPSAHLAPAALVKETLPRSPAEPLCQRLAHIISRFTSTRVSALAPCWATDNKPLCSARLSVLPLTLDPLN